MLCWMPIHCGRPVSLQSRLIELERWRILRGDLPALRVCHTSALLHQVRMHLCVSTTAALHMCTCKHGPMRVHMHVRTGETKTLSCPPYRLPFLTPRSVDWPPKCQTQKEIPLRDLTNRSGLYRPAWCSPSSCPPPTLTCRAKSRCVALASGADFGFESGPVNSRQQKVQPLGLIATRT